MNEQHERLLKLDDNKLIDVVKNYRQHGYSEDLRESAIEILTQRGISIEQLHFAGNLENHTFEHAKHLYESFLRNSKITFVMCLILFVSRVAILNLKNVSIGLASTILVLSILSFVLYCIFLIRSFMIQNQFYRSIGQEYGAEGALLYFLLGMPFYIFMYFHFRNQMKNKMNEIE